MRARGICLVKDCSGVCHANGLCHKHYLQYRKHGRVFERTRYTKNKITISDEIAYVSLCDVRGNEIAKAIIDSEDVERVAAHKWHKMGSGYASTSIGRKSMLMHRFINNTPEGMLTDHVNQNNLDNRKANLRTCDDSGNMMNRGASVVSASKIRGVFFHKQTGKWTAEKYFQNKRHYLGLFDTQAEAKRAYDEKHRELLGK